MQKKSKKSTTSASEKALKVLKVTTNVARVLVVLAALVSCTYALRVVLASRELLFAFGLGCVVTSLLYIIVVLF